MAKINLVFSWVGKTQWLWRASAVWMANCEYHMLCGKEIRQNISGHQNIRKYCWRENLSVWWPGIITDIKEKFQKVCIVWGKKDQNRKGNVWLCSMPHPHYPLKMVTPVYLKKNIIQVTMDYQNVSTLLTLPKWHLFFSYGIPYYIAYLSMVHRLLQYSSRPWQENLTFITSSAAYDAHNQMER